MLAAAFTTPSEDDEQLARAWARAGELAVALREVTEELALVQRENHSLHEEIDSLRSERGGSA